MKKILLAVLATAAMMSTVTVSAQQTIYRTSYFMEGSTFRNYMNPAFRPYRGYVNIPVAGNVNFGMNTSGITVSSLLYPMNGELVPFWDKDVTWDKLSAKLQQNNGVDMSVNTSLIGFGFYTGPSFWSFSLDLRTDVGFSIPQQMFAFLKKGSGSYDVSNLSVGAEAYLSASIGYSRRIFSNLTVGGRVNFLGGLARANLHYDNMHLTRGIDEWAIKAHGTFEISAGFEAGTTNENGEKYVDFDNFSIDLSNIGGLAGTGVTFDLGAEYTLLDRVTFSASVLDIGGMKWRSGFRSVAEENYTIREFSEDLEDLDLGGLYKFRELSSSSKTKGKIYPTVVIGAELDIFGNDILGFGLLFVNRRNQFVDRYSELSFALTVRPPGNWFSASINYVARQNKVGGGFGDNLGMAINFHPKGFNFFVGTDYMVSKITSRYAIPVNQDRFNFYMGMAISLGKEKPKPMMKLGI